MSGPVGIGVIGCGMVSHAYLGTICRAPSLALRALASRTGNSAQAQAMRYGGTAMSIDALIANPDIAIIVNLAPPAVHHSIGRAALDAGKHLYTEKPMATSLAEADELLALAEAKGLYIGAAPDTFLGAGHQAVRRLIDEGVIGRVTGGAAAFGTPGMEGWHPNPSPFYARGGGPLLDIGPYYVTQLVNILGPVKEVTAIATRPRSRRTATAPGQAGETIDVEVPTTVNGALLFEQGANVSLSLSWDVPNHGRAPIELYGHEGSLVAPDPNGFDGAMKTTARGGGWISTGESGPARRMDMSALAAAVAALSGGVDPVTGGPVDAQTALRFGDQRGLGLIDLSDAILTGREPRASGRLARHVLEVLLGLDRSAREGRIVTIGSRVERPAPVAPA